MRHSSPAIRQGTGLPSRGRPICRQSHLLALFVLVCSGAFAAAEPDKLIPVGDSPIALALSPDGQQAVVVILFPVRNLDGTTGPNIPGSGTQINAFKLGTRLVSVALAGVSTTQGIGLNSQNGASISCTGSNTFNGNIVGNVGSVTGCP